MSSRPYRGRGSYRGTDHRARNSSPRRTVGNQDSHARSASTRGRSGYCGHRGARGGGRVETRIVPLLMRLAANENDVTLQIKNSELVTALQHGNLEFHILPNLFKVLHKVCLDETSPELAYDFLLDVLNTSFFKDRASQMVSNNFVRIEALLSDNIEEFIFDFLSVLTYFYMRFENACYENLSVLLDVLQVNFRRMEKMKMKSITPDVIEVYDELIVLHETVQENRMARMTISNPKLKQKRERKEEIDDRKPPDDFRQLSVIPTAEDLNCDSRDVFIRVNRMEGRYQDSNDYLDVQFRLMREDFLSPLRDGIREFLSMHTTSRKKLQNVRLYKNIKVGHSIPTDDGIVYEVCLDLKQTGRIIWERSKRLIFGSLLCFSSDDFKSIYFGTVSEREIDTLYKGYFFVKFVNGVPPKDADYTMLESVVYFEAYRHVLVRLTNIKCDPLPFAAYLVDCSAEVAQPDYLRRRAILSYDLSVIAADTELRMTAANRLAVSPCLENAKWPNKEYLGLDESQMEALKTALTKELVLIQGPPGTGKTYMGLKIVKVLNRCVQDQIRDFGPILIVCYTNHALDQFLEGIQGFLPSGGIVRVGGRCKSESLNNFSINKLRQQMITSRTVPVDVFRLMGRIKSELKETRGSIIGSRQQIQKACTQLVEFHHISPYMSDHHIRDLQEITKGKKSIIRCWLFDEVDTYSFETEVEYACEDVLDLIIYETLEFDLEQHCQFFLFYDPLFLEDDDTEIAVEDETQWETGQRTLEEESGTVRADTVLRTLNATSTDRDDYYENASNNDGGWTTVIKNRRKFIRNKLSRRTILMMTEDEAQNVLNMWELMIEDRWRLYLFWLNQFIEKQEETSKELEAKFERLSEQRKELRFQEDLSIMKNAKIVGMTTTGAARYGKILAKLGCKIIVVEEAAEVLESHVISTLNPECNHLILIGDHKQLKPSPAVFRLAREFNLDISLFERMIKNDVCYDTLKYQHRMRPEISEIMKFIYPDLHNHSSVNGYEPIRGVGVNLYFIDHKERERFADDILSYLNPFEAEYAVALCKHFLLNGYSPDKITILTLYAAQLFQIKKLMPHNVFNGVRLCVVDNYQGEENEIIIISLVRSNDEDNIGFLGIDNRICVALSRARNGLFVLGNSDLLSGCTKSKSKLWYDIIQHLVRKDRLGQFLPLKCQIHSDDPAIEAYNADDFKKVSNGGCQKICGKRLDCGHACPKLCHPIDQEHKEFQCMKKCERNRKCDHPCPRKCYQECIPCEVKVPKIIPGCGHSQEVECNRNVNAVVCQIPCKKVLACGHPCSRTCGQACDVKCRHPVKRTLRYCGHRANVPCSVNSDDFQCTEHCRETLGCGHQCLGTCGQCAFGRLHQTCKEPCQKTLTCGHICKTPCSNACPPCCRNCDDNCSHNRCPKLCGEECVPCREDCAWSCPHKKCTKKCGEMCDREPCEERCTRKLACHNCKRTYKCIGLCGEGCPRFCPFCNQKALKDIMEFYASEAEFETARFITLWTCRHLFEVTSLDNWMKTQSREVKRKACPQCSTPIVAKSCFRYLKQTKEFQAKLQLVQNEYNKRNDNSGDLPALMRKARTIDRKLDEMGTYFDIPMLNDFYKKHVAQLNHRKQPVSDIFIYENSLKLYDSLYSLYDQFRKLIMKSDEEFHVLKSFKNALIWLSPLKRKFNDFEVTQITGEIERIRFSIAILHGIKNSQEEHKPKWLSEFQKLSQCKTFGDDLRKQIEVKIKELRKLGNLPGLGITKEEGIKIHSALGLQQGHWFVCPNNHPYIITECGGAMEEGSCPECNAQIGGQSHRLRGDNRHFGMFDNSRYAHFSDQFNVENFNFDNI